MLRTLADAFIRSQITDDVANFTPGRFMAWLADTHPSIDVNRYSAEIVLNEALEGMRTEVTSFLATRVVRAASQRNQIAAGVVARVPQLDGESFEDYQRRLRSEISAAILAWESDRSAS